MKKINFEYTANDFFELASQQRLQIIFKLMDKNLKLTVLAKEIDATSQEIHRNLIRLENNGFVQKEKNGYFTLTTFGKTICEQIPSIIFLSENRKYFDSHDFCGIPIKFVMRVGQLADGKQVKGVVKVFEQWKEIKKNAEEYFYEIISEIPLDLIRPLVKRLEEKSELDCQCIISKSVIVPKGRKELLKKLKFEKLIKEGRIKRKMFNVQTVLVLNEKEACLSFPSINGEPDISKMFYSNDLKFHEWCLDYFRYCWYGGSEFDENRIKE